MDRIQNHGMYTLIENTFSPEHEKRVDAEQRLTDFRNNDPDLFCTELIDFFHSFPQNVDSFQFFHSFGALTFIQSMTRSMLPITDDTILKLTEFSLQNYYISNEKTKPRSITIIFTLYEKSMMKNDGPSYHRATMIESYLFKLLASQDNEINLKGISLASIFLKNKLKPHSQIFQQKTALYISSLLFVTDSRVNQKAFRVLCKYGASVSTQNIDIIEFFQLRSKSIVKIIQKSFDDGIDDTGKKLIKSFSELIWKFPACFVAESHRILKLVPRILKNFDSITIRNYGLPILRVALELLPLTRRSAFFSFLEDLLELVSSKVDAEPGESEEWPRELEEALYISMTTYCEHNSEIRIQVEGMAQKLGNIPVAVELIQYLLLITALSYSADDKKRAEYLTRGLELAKNRNFLKRYYSYSLIEAITSQKPINLLKDFFKPILELCFGELDQTVDELGFKALKVLSNLFKDDLGIGISNEDRVFVASQIYKKWSITILHCTKGSLCFEALESILSPLSDPSMSLLESILNSFSYFQYTKGSSDFRERLKIFDHLLSFLLLADFNQRTKYQPFVAELLADLSEELDGECENNTDSECGISENLAWLVKVAYILSGWSKYISLYGELAFGDLIESWEHILLRLNRLTLYNANWTSMGTREKQKKELEMKFILNFQSLVINFIKYDLEKRYRGLIGSVLDEVMDYEVETSIYFRPETVAIFAKTVDMFDSGYEASVMAKFASTLAFQISDLIGRLVPHHIVAIFQALGGIVSTRKMKLEWILKDFDLKILDLCATEIENIKFQVDSSSI